MKYIIEGIDRLGKSTLVDNIQHKLGYHLVIHYDKPKKLDCYGMKYTEPLKIYQQEVNHGMFDLIQNSKAPIIFDRGHLGECVYAPLYRKYSGDYVFDIEKHHKTDDVKLILLTTSNFDICVDDGESFNFDNKEKEQQLFIDAFTKSNLNKVMIDVYDSVHNCFRSELDILHEALSEDT